LFINATPCVLPVLSIKVLGFVQQARESRGRTLMLGLAFGVGVMIFFVLLGLLAASGRNILQYPIAVIALGAIVMALALNMLGVYTLQAPDAASKLEAKIGQEGVAASFGKGALAPVLGFACTGPLMAGMFGFAAKQEPGVAIAAFLVTGLGMASPYVLLGANPNWLGFLPRPGQWMITFERIMGFLLLGMVIWLIHPLITHIGATGFEWTLVFLVVVALSCWLLGQVQITMPARKRWSYRGGAAGMVVLSWAVIFGMVYPLSEAQGGHTYAGGNDWSKGVPWRPWTVEEAVRSGKTVFVDFTAAWCTVCKQNKGRAINTPEVLARMEEYGVIPMQGDWTGRGPEIAAMLAKYDRAGVPLNLIFPAGRPDEPIVLTPNLTKQYLLDKLEEAGPSRDANILAANR
jgi:thiol:disulfide interchange protein DsbD